MSSIICPAPLLAHQGGWDEVLLVGVPILLIIGLLAVAKRRVEAQVAVRGGDDGTSRDADDNTGHDVSGA
jgi:hypothetical protein